MTRAARILALLVTVSTLPFAASAQGVTSVDADRAASPAAEVADAWNAIDFAADSLTYDQGSDIVTAEGNVILSYKGRIVHAERVVYNRATGRIAVEGELWARDSGGNIVTARDLILDEDFNSGIIQNIGFILSDNSRFAAERGRLTEEGRTVLERAVYSPCEVCADGSDQPLWQVKAVRVIHDRGTKRVTYRDAFIELFGVPLLYTPYFSHPDPTVHAASGLLAPGLGQSSDLGLVFRLPYYINLAPHRDMTIEPILTTREGFVLAGEYREHVGLGKFKVAGSITHVDERDDFGVETGDKEFRGHIFSDGRFRLPSLSRYGGQWQWRYDVGWASDDTYLRRYDFSTIDTIKSEAALERFGTRSYAALTALGFQGLRVEDVAGLTPFALPMLEYHYVSAPGLFGGTYRFDANALALTRFDGMDSRRLSLGTSWEVPYIGESGSVYTLGASLRGDIYHVNSAAAPDDPAYGGENGATARFLPQIRLEWRLPMVKDGLTTRQTLEPIVALVGAFKSGNPDAIPNEDSRIVGFDDTNLFASSRFTGLDRWESGSRIDYGVRYGIEGSKVSARMLVGQSYRFFDDPEIPVGTGLSGHWSDIVGKLEVTFSPYLDLIYRARLNDRNLALRRNEVDAVFGPDNFKVTLGYLNLDTGAEDFDPSTDFADREEIRGAAVYRLDREWTLSGSYTYSLDRKESVYARGGVAYEDECLRFGFFVARRFTRDRDIDPETSFIFQISLKNLG